MSGLVKAKKYDWKDSNLALFGSDTEKKVKKDSAETEPAWNGAGSKPGVQIWRIQKFKVTHQPKNDYGKFFNGDSYIILNTYKEPDNEELLYDVHFWIGQYSTQDEYGTAAYKTVELDTLLDDKPVQHREVMGYESQLFKSYFESLTLMNGGSDSGFRHVEPEKYELRLFHFRRGAKNVEVKEVPALSGNLNSGDVFIIDNGLEIFQWNGETCNKDEKYKATQYVQTLKSERGGKPKVETVEEAEKNDKIAELLKEGSSTEIQRLKVEAGYRGEWEPGTFLLHEDELEVSDDNFQPTLLRLSDETGNLDTTLVSEGSMTKSLLNTNDVFIADTGKALFVWIGNKASEAEKKNGLTYAHNYLKKSKHPLIPVTVLKESQKNKEFETIFS